MKLACFDPGRRFMGRLSHECDLLEEFEQLCRKEGIRCAVFTAIGALTRATLGFYQQEQKKYHTIELDFPLEIASLSGNISIKDGKIMAHAHAVLSDENGRSWAGHLFPNSTIFAGEFFLQELVGEAWERRFDPQTGLYLW